MTAVIGVAPRVPAENVSERVAGAGHGPGMQMMLGTVEIFRFEKVCVPEHPLKLCPTVSVVSASSDDTLKLMALPCAVVPAHCPALSDGDGRVGDPPQPTHISAAYTAVMKTLIGAILIVIGLIGLIWGGISYTREEKVVDLGPIEATAERREQIPIGPVVGGIALVGGIIILVTGRKR